MGPGHPWGRRRCGTGLRPHCGGGDAPCAHTTRDTSPQRPCVLQVKAVTLLLRSALSHGGRHTEQATEHSQVPSPNMRCPSPARPWGRHLYTTVPRGTGNTYRTRRRGGRAASMVGTRRPLQGRGGGTRGSGGVTPARCRLSWAGRSPGQRTCCCSHSPASLWPQDWFRDRRVTRCW